MNKQLPNVADAIYEHDKTEMAEPFSAIENRLKNIFIEIAQDISQEKDCKILVVTHAFLLKTLFYLFAPEQLYKIDKIKNSTVSLLKFDNGKFFIESDLL